MSAGTIPTDSLPGPDELDLETERITDTGGRGKYKRTAESRRKQSESMKAKAAERKARGLRGDPTPKGKAKAAKPKPPAPDDAALAGSLSELLALSAIPTMAVTRCAFCVGHLISEAPPTAAGIVELSRDRPELRAMLERMHSWWNAATVVGVIGKYAAIPLVHHVAPLPVAATLGPFLNGGQPLPPRPEGHNHRHANPAAPPEGAPATAPYPESDQGGGFNAA